MQRFIVALTIVALTIVALTVVTASAVAAQAMPVGRDHRQQSVIVAVADKCGINRYRDANGVCRRTHQNAKPSKQFYSTCGGVNAHRVCNWTGQCWMVCD